MMKLRDKIALRLEQARDDFWTWISYVASWSEEHQYDHVQLLDPNDGFEFEDHDIHPDYDHHDISLDDEYDHEHAEHHDMDSVFDNDDSPFEDHHHSDY